MAISFTSNFEVPAVIDKGASVPLRITIHGTGGSLTNMEFYVRTPNRTNVDLSGQFTDVSSNLPYSFISLFELSYTFSMEGLYTFFLHDTTTSEVWVASVYSATWAANIDKKVSEVFSQRVELSRLRTTVRNEDQRRRK